MGYSLKDKVTFSLGRQVGLVGCLFSLESVNGSLYSAIKVATNITAIKNLKAVKETFTRIDDFIDESYPNDFIKYDATSKAGEKSEFLQFVLTDTKEKHGGNKFVKKFFELLEKGDQFSHDLIKFGNLLCDLSKKELSAKIDGNRNGATKLHKDIAGVNVALFSYIIKSSQGKNVTLKNTSVDSVKKLFPVSFNIGSASQILDDIHDFVIDLNHEKRTGIISSNYMLTKLNNLGKGEDIPELLRDKNTPSAFKGLASEMRNDVKKELSGTSYLAQQTIMKSYELYAMTKFSMGRDAY